MLEVEIKSRFNEVNLQLLMNLNPVFLKTEVQEDVYFNHPLRDFSKTDEALRIRKIDEKYFLTYKGKKVDNDTKTREEIEISCSKEMIIILEKLGFKKVAEVKKTRKLFLLENLKICLDDVSMLGKFIEIESNNYEDKEKIFEILKKIGLQKKDTIRESYLELMFRKENASV